VILSQYFRMNADHRTPKLLQLPLKSESDTKICIDMLAHMGHPSSVE